MLPFRNSWRNSFHADTNAFRKSLIREQYTFPVTEPTVPVKRPSTLRYVVWPALVICVPVTSLVVILLVVVFSKRIIPQQNALLNNDTRRYENDILVNFSASESTLSISCWLALTHYSTYRVPGELSLNHRTSSLVLCHVSICSHGLGASERSLAKP
jgi:hypothetical protein